MLRGDHLRDWTRENMNLVQEAKAHQEGRFAGHADEDVPQKALWPLFLG